MSSNWKDILKTQLDLESMNAELDTNHQTISANIDKILKSNRYQTKPEKKSNISSVSETYSNHKDKYYDNDDTYNETYENELDVAIKPISFENDDIILETNSSKSPQSKGMTKRNSIVENSPTDLELPKAPDAQSRFLKAKVKMLEKQVSDHTEIRKQLNEQVSDLQKQLKLEKDETKLLRKRVSLLEIEGRRNSKKVGGDATSQPSGDDNEQVVNELNQAKKDLQAAERMMKQFEQSNKSKDTQLKRALETISRLKLQLSELETSTQKHGSLVDRAMFDATEQKLKSLEKQKLDLISAFKKQMRLIDILKRQKAHLEAAKLLTFTEEEFMRSLDWAS